MGRRENKRAQGFKMPGAELGRPISASSAQRASWQGDPRVSGWNSPNRYGGLWDVGLEEDRGEEWSWAVWEMEEEELSFYRGELAVRGAARVTASRRLRRGNRVGEVGAS